MGELEEKGVPVEPSTNVEVSQALDFDDVDPTFAKRVLRKIDSRILVCMLCTYTLNFIDKTLLGRSAIFGIITSAHLVGQQFSWLSSIFYFGYLFWEYPTTILIQKLPIGKYLSLTVIIWGAVVAITAACSNFGGLATCRFLLGLLEATVTPSFVYIVSMWYTRDEAPVRTGLWFVGNDVGAILAAFIAYGIGNITQPLKPWQWLFIIFGAITFLWGCLMLYILPDTIKSAKFLTEEEKDYAERRVVLNGTGRLDPFATGKWRPEQAFECLLDPKTWFFFASYILTQIPNGGTQNFGDLVIQGFGFTTLQTILLNMPAAIIAGIAIAGTGWIAGRYRNITTYLIAATMAPPIAGASIIYATSGKGVRLFGFYLMSTGFASNPLSLSLIAANFKGATKKMTVTAVVFVAYCVGNIAGPQFFKSTQAPEYRDGFKAIIICYSLAILAALGLRYYMIWQNRVRDRAEGPMALSSGGDTNIASSDAVDPQAYEDITDYKARGFRYRL